jgi:hypothetical protein
MRKSLILLSSVVLRRFDAAVAAVPCKPLKSNVRRFLRRLCRETPHTPSAYTRARGAGDARERGATVTAADRSRGYRQRTGRHEHVIYLG